jgi:hypothetical protein
MALESLSSMPAIFGMTQSGGKPKSRKTSKTSKTTMRKTKKSGKRGGNNEIKYDCSCTKREQLALLPPSDAANPTNIGVSDAAAQATADVKVPATGGMSKMQYKAYLAKMDVKRLYKMAKNKGIKITKKKDGKTTYIKKDTVIQKLCDAMHGKKK